LYPPKSYFLRVAAAFSVNTICPLPDSDDSDISNKTIRADRYEDILLDQRGFLQKLPGLNFDTKVRFFF
jgi:hypothetical protein